MNAPRGAAGHRVLPHTADVRIEAWAPTREACVGEAVRAIVACFVDTPGVPPVRWHRFSVRGADDARLLVDALDEVVFLLDTTGEVPVEVSVADTGAGLEVAFGLADVHDLPQVGAVPKAVSLHELRLERTAAGWACAATVDV